MKTASLAIAFLFVVCLALPLVACGGDGGEDEDLIPAAGKIAFQSDRDGNYEVYVMNADGSGQTKLTDNPAGDAVPGWSP